MKRPVLILTLLGCLALLTAKAQTPAIDYEGPTYFFTTSKCGLDYGQYEPEGDFSVAITFKMGSNGVLNTLVDNKVTNTAADGDGAGWRIRVNGDGYVEAYFINGALESLMARTETAVNSGDAYHYVFVAEKQEDDTYLGSCYINGEKEGIDRASVARTFNTKSNMYVGIDYNETTAEGATPYFMQSDMWLKKFQVFEKALSESEIAALVEEQKDEYGDVWFDDTFNYIDENVVFFTANGNNYPNDLIIKDNSTLDIRWSSVTVKGSVTLGKNCKITFSDLEERMSLTPTVSVNLTTDGHLTMDEGSEYIIPELNSRLQTGNSNLMGQNNLSHLILEPGVIMHHASTNSNSNIYGHIYLKENDDKYAQIATGVTVPNGAGEYQIAAQKIFHIVREYGERKKWYPLGTHVSFNMTIADEEGNILTPGEDFLLRRFQNGTWEEVGYSKVIVGEGDEAKEVETQMLQSNVAYMIYIPEDAPHGTLYLTAAAFNTTTLETDISNGRSASTLRISKNASSNKTILAGRANVYSNTYFSDMIVPDRDGFYIYEFDDESGNFVVKDKNDALNPTEDLIVKPRGVYGIGNASRHGDDLFTTEFEWAFTPLNAIAPEMGTASTDYEQLNLTISNDRYKDILRIRQWDDELSLPKIPAVNDAVPQIYASITETIEEDGEYIDITRNYTILNSADDAEKEGYPVTIDINENGQYTVSAEKTAGITETVNLVDEDGNAHDLSAGDYTFNASAGDQFNFKLIIGTILSIDKETVDGEKISVYTKNGMLYVNGSNAKVYSIDGRFIKEVKDGEPTPLNNGIFIINAGGKSVKVLN